MAGFSIVAMRRSRPQQGVAGDDIDAERTEHQRGLGPRPGLGGERRGDDAARRRYATCTPSGSGPLTSGSDDDGASRSASFEAIALNVSRDAPLVTFGPFIGRGGGHTGR